MKKISTVWGGNLTIYIPQSPVPTVDLFEKLDKTFLKRVAWKNHTGNEGLTIWFRIHEKKREKIRKINSRNIEYWLSPWTIEIHRIPPLVTSDADPKPTWFAYIFRISIRNWIKHRRN